MMKNKLLILLWIGYCSCNTYQSKPVNVNQDVVNDVNTDTSYYESGNIKVINTYMDTTLEGPSMAYFETGKLHKIINFKNDLKHGPATYYYENGNISTKANFEEGNLAGHILKYYPTGEISQYGTFDYEGRGAYIVDYDKQGNVINQSGRILNQYWRDSSKVHFLYSLPPSARIEINVDYKNRLDSSFTFSKLNVHEFQVEIPIDFPAEQFRISASLYDSVTNMLIRRDTIWSLNY